MSTILYDAKFYVPGVALDHVEVQHYEGNQEAPYVVRAWGGYDGFLQDVFGSWEEAWARVLELQKEVFKT